jgi:hypothetical protein
MKTETMLQLLKEGKDPLDVSIQKWQDIVNNNGFDKDNEDGQHSDNCALCHTYMPKHCDGCPVSKKKGAYCSDTPYYDWAGCGNGRLFEHPESDSLKYARKELAFLKRLKRSVAVVLQDSSKTEDEKQDE